MTRNPLEVLAMTEAIAGLPPTHRVVATRNGEVLYRGAKAEAEWIAQGYQKDFVTDHPMNVGPVIVEPIPEG